MGSVKFNADLTVTSVYGHPSQLSCSGITVYNSKDIPNDIIKAHRAINIFETLPDGVVDGINNSDNINIVSALFGCNSSSIEYEWTPTDYVVDGFRAWCFHKRFTEGGGEGYFGNPTDHDWIIAGAWINDKKLSAWADRLISSSRLAQLIANNWDNLSYIIVCDDETVTQTEGCIINKTWYAVDDTVVLIQSGRFYKIDLYLKTPKPDMWCISRDSDYINGMYYPFLLANNGGEKRKFAYMDIPIDNYNQLFTNDLSIFSDYIPPVDITGKYTIYFPKMDELRNFFINNNITAKLIHKHDIAIVNLEWRNKAFSAGALPYPQYEVIPPDVKHGDSVGKHTISIYGNCLHVMYDGFLFMPPGLEYPLCKSIRSVGDSTLGRDEIRIFEDGTV